MADFKEFWEATVGQFDLDAIGRVRDIDALSVVLRVSFFYERVVESCQRKLLPAYEQAKIGKLRYSDKVSLLEAFGFDPQATKFLRAVNSIRNKAAHDESFAFDDLSVRDFLNGNASFVKRAEARKQIDEGWTKDHLKTRVGADALLMLLAVSTTTLVEDCVALLNAHRR